MNGVLNARQNWWLDYQMTVSQTTVGLPAETILLGERHSVRAYYNRDIYGAWDLNDVVFYGWTGDLPGQGPLASDLWGPPTSKPGSLAVPYAGSSTFTFVDGHSTASNPMKTINGSGYNNMNCDTTYHKYWDARRTQ